MSLNSRDVCKSWRSGFNRPELKREKVLRKHVADKLATDLVRPERTRRRVVSGCSRESMLEGLVGLAST